MSDSNDKSTWNCQVTQILVNSSRQRAYNNTVYVDIKYRNLGLKSFVVIVSPVKKCIILMKPPKNCHLDICCFFIYTMKFIVVQTFTNRK